MRWSMAGNAMLGLLAIATVVLVAVAVWVTMAPSPSPERGDPHPFAMDPEFPRSREQDGEALRKAAQQALGTDDVAGDLDGVGVLTSDGKRSGAYGQLSFDPPVPLLPETRFLVCETPLGLMEFEEIHGLYVVILDGHQTPYHLLPLDRDGMLPRPADLKVETECNGHSH